MTTRWTVVVVQGWGATRTTFAHRILAERAVAGLREQGFQAWIEEG